MKKKIVSLLILSLFILARPGYAKDKGLEVHFIDVGQGDSIFVRTPDNKTILIDAGIHYASQDGYNPFLYLKKLKVTKLDAIFITHPHDDHYKGFKYLCTKKGEKEFPVKAVYYSVEPGEAYGKFEECLDEIIKRSDDYGQVSARGPPLKFGDVVFTVLYPQEPIDEPSKNKNLDSVVMKMVYKDVSFMFTGDADKKVERSLTGDLKSTVLKVGHHGSRTSTDEEFLEKVSPTYAVISSNDIDGKGKTYAHPHKEALVDLKERKVKLYRTDLSGNIKVLTDGGKISVKVDEKISQDDPQLWKPGKKGK